MATKAELRNKVLQRLGVIDPEETPSSADANTVEEAYLELYDELRKSGHVSWASGGSIPSEAVRPLVNVIAYELLPEFLVPGEQAMKIQSAYQSAIRRLRAVMSEPYTSDSKFSEYF